MKIFLSFLIFLGSAAPILADDEFEFYFNEFVENQAEVDRPLSKLITKRLAEATLDSPNGDLVRSRIQRINDALIEHPEKIRSFIDLNGELNRQFDTLLDRARTKRWLYAAGGALIGAAVALPVGKYFGPSGKVLWLVVPAAALAGGGAGFLLGHLLLMPQYSRGEIDLIEDHQDLLDQINEVQ